MCGVEGEYNDKVRTDEESVPGERYAEFGAIGEVDHEEERVRG